MKKYEGILETLGESNTDAPITTYSYIAIGGEHLSKISCYSGLKGKLDSNLGQAITLLVHSEDVSETSAGSKPLILGVKTSNGKTYCTNFPELSNRTAWLMIIFLGLPTLPLFGMGAFFIVHAAIGIIKQNKVKKLKNLVDTHYPDSIKIDII
jgi:hypothetical protein